MFMCVRYSAGHLRMPPLTPLRWLIMTSSPSIRRSSITKMPLRGIKNPMRKRYWFQRGSGMKRHWLVLTWLPWRCGRVPDAWLQYFTLIKFGLLVGGLTHWSLVTHIYQRTGSSLVKVMALYQTSHYLTQYWLRFIVNGPIGTIWIKNLNQNTIIVFQEDIWKCCLINVNHFIQASMCSSVETDSVSPWLAFNAVRDGHPGGRFKNAYQLINLGAHKFSFLNQLHIFQCMGKIFSVEFQRVPLKFHTKDFTHTLKDASLKI